MKYNFNESYYKCASWLCEDEEDEELDLEDEKDSDDFEEDEDSDDEDESEDDEELEDIEEIECPDCDGTGETEDGEECPTCGGTGLIDDGEDADDFEEDVEEALNDDDEESEDDADLDDEEMDDEDADEEVHEIDLANPVCPCCGAKLVFTDATDEDEEDIEELDVQPEEAEAEEGDTLDIDGFEVADAAIMGPEQSMYYSDEDVGTTVDIEDVMADAEDFEEDEEEEEEVVEAATLAAYNATNYLIEDPSYEEADVAEAAEYESMGEKLDLVFDSLINEGFEDDEVNAILDNIDDNVPGWEMMSPEEIVDTIYQNCYPE